MQAERVLEVEAVGKTQILENRQVEHNEVSSKKKDLSSQK